MTYAHKIYHLAHNYPGGVVALATAMQMGEKVLQNKVNPNTETHDLGSKRQLEMFLDFTNGNQETAEYFAAKCNAVVVKLPEVANLGDMALLDSFMAIMRELGDLSSEFQTAYADGEINKKEFEKIAIEVAAVQSKLLAFQAAIQTVVR